MNRASLKSYVLGYGLSVLLTLDAYWLVSKHLLTGAAVVAAILALALAQLGVQLWFFLHLGDESGPRWRLVTFLGMLGVLLIVVLGSLWIMNHLNYNMTPQDMNNYLIHSSE
jgi:cytochrome o ubiquinol oxidase operon protein cyoD